MTGKERIDLIKQIITNEKKASVSNLSEHFNVTEETIRRDLDKLEEEGIVTRTYGGAILNSLHQKGNVHFYKRAEKNLIEKQKIALKALSILGEKFTLSADSSSTVMELLKLIKDRNDITVLTNSTEALHELAIGEINVVSTGGELNRNSLSLQGSLTKETIRKYNLDYFVMSCKGLDLTAGALDSNESEAEIKKIMIEQSEVVILLVDHSKFDKKAFLQLVDLNRLDYIVTNRKPDNEEWIEFCEKNNIKLIY